MNNKAKPAPPPPRWWSPSAGFWTLAVFGVLASIPYVSSATKLAADGKTPSIKMLAQEAKKKGEGEKLREIKGLVTLADGSVYGSGKLGLFRLDADQWVSVPGFEEDDVKALAMDGAGVLYAVHADGVSTLKMGNREEIYEGEVHNITVTSEGAVYLATRKPAVLKRREADGTWTTVNDGLPID